jgi:hypothetical protein
MCFILILFFFLVQRVVCMPFLVTCTEHYCSTVKSVLMVTCL